jgi:hypothetical protein
MLGTNRDYKTMGRKVDLALKYHVKRMAELEATGSAKEEASKQAFEEVKALGNKGLLKMWRKGEL